jgi:hypothetical protein
LAVEVTNIGPGLPYHQRPLAPKQRLTLGHVRQRRLELVFDQVYFRRRKQTRDSLRLRVLSDVPPQKYRFGLNSLAMAIRSVFPMSSSVSRGSAWRDYSTEA